MAATTATVSHVPIVQEPTHHPDIPTTPRISRRKVSLSSPTETLAFSNPPYTPNSGINHQSNPFMNWHNYSMNGMVNANFTDQDRIPSPPLSLSASSPQSSLMSSPTDPASLARDTNTSSYFNSCRPRSKSFAVPMATGCCANCGLRRSSTLGDEISSSTRSLSTTIIIPQGPHLPLHMHCQDDCPDDVMPPKGASSPILTHSPSAPYPTRRHHRRRSSLCFAESLIEDAEVMDNDGVPIEMKQNWEKHARNIARKVILRKPGVEEPTVAEEEVIEHNE